MNGADSFRNTRFVWASASTGRPGFMIRRRRTRSGKGTHARVMQGIDTLRRNGVPFHVICVIGAQSLDAVDELMDFFIAEGIRDVGFNIEEIEGVNRSSTLQQDDIDTRFRQVLRAAARSRAGRPIRLWLSASGRSCWPRCGIRRSAG